MPTILSAVKTAFGAASATLRQLKKGDGIVHPNDTLPNYPGAATDVKLTYFQSATRKFPALTSVASTTFGTYNGSTFPYTIVVNVTDSVSSSVGTYASDKVTFTGTVAPSTTPTTGAFVLTGYYGRTTSISTQTGTSAAPALPTFGSVQSTTIGSYNGTAFPYTIVVNVGNTTGSSVGSYASAQVTFTGTVAQSTTPATGAFRITGANGGYIDVTTRSGTSAAPALPSFGSVTGTTINSDYNGSTFGYTITVSVSNASSTNAGSLSGSQVTFTGRVAPSTTPSTGGFRISGANGGYADIASKSGTQGAPAAPAAPTPSISANNGTSYSAYNGSKYPISSWTLTTANTTSVSINTYTGFSGAASISYSGNTIYVTGLVNVSTTPSITFNLTNSVGGYTTATATPGPYNGSSTCAAPFATTPSITANNASSYSAYNGSAYPISSWTLSTANTTSISLYDSSGFSGAPSVSLSGSTIYVTGNVTSSTTPSVRFNLYNAVGGYTTASVSPTQSYNGTATGNPIAPTPSVTSMSAITYDDGSEYSGEYFNGSAWTFNVTNTTSVSVASSNLSWISTLVLSNDKTKVIIGGAVPPNVVPSISLTLSNAAAGLTTTTITTQSYAGTQSPAPWTSKTYYYQINDLYSGQITGTYSAQVSFRGPTLAAINVKKGAFPSEFNQANYAVGESSVSKEFAMWLALDPGTAPTITQTSLNGWNQDTIIDWNFAATNVLRNYGATNITIINHDLFAGAPVIEYTNVTNPTAPQFRITGNAYGRGQQPWVTLQLTNGYGLSTTQTFTAELNLSAPDD